MIKYIFILFIFMMQCEIWAHTCDSIQNIVYQGLNRTSLTVVQRAQLSRINHTLDSQLLRQEINEWKSLDLFAAISVSCNENTLVYQFTELPNGLLLPSVNKTDLDGWSVGLQGAFLNLGGNDIRIEGRWSTAIEPIPFRKQEGFLQFSSPWFLNIPLEYKGVFARTHSPQEKGWIEKSNRGEFELNYPSNQPFQWILRSDLIQLDTNRALGWQVPLSTGLGLGYLYDQRDLKTQVTRGYYLQNLWQIFGPHPANYQLYQIDLQTWTPLNSRWIWQNGILLRLRTGHIPNISLYRTGGPNTMRSYPTGYLGLNRQEGLMQSELQYRFIPQTAFKIPYLGWDLYSGMDLVFGIENAWLSPQTPQNGQNWPGSFGGLHLLLPGFERIRFEFGYPLAGANRTLQWNIGLFQKINTQLWVRR